MEKIKLFVVDCLSTKSGFYENAVLEVNQETAKQFYKDLNIPESNHCMFILENVKTRYKLFRGRTISVAYDRFLEWAMEKLRENEETDVNFIFTAHDFI